MAEDPYGQDMLQTILQQMRVTFMEELPEKLGRLERLLIEMEHTGAQEDRFNEAYRNVHSLKGSGGTFGLHIITTICHQMEDLLNSTEGGKKLNQHVIAFSLKYLDLLHLVQDQIKTGAEKFPYVEEQLDSLRSQLAPKHHSVLLANDSKLETNICLKALADLPVRTAVVTDGLQALTRALSEHFDLIITANEIPRLSGVALIGALNLSDLSHSRFKTILLTSNKDLAGSHGADANYIVLKDDKLVQNLTLAVSDALALPNRKGQ